MTPSNRHINPTPEIKKQIEDFRNGTLSEQETDALWAQLLENPAWQDYLHTLNALEAIADDPAAMEAIMPEESATTSRQYWKAYVAAAAVLIIGSMLGLILLFSPQQPEQTLPHAKLEMHNLRSAQSLSGDDQNHLQAAISLYISGDYSQALEKIEPLTESAESDQIRRDALLNQGIILYNTGEFEKAYVSFNRVYSDDQATDLLREKALWFAANAKLQSGDTDRAEKLIREVKELDGAYSRVANDFLQLKSGRN